MSRVLPILFNQEMVRALLNGKTATRRKVKSSVPIRPDHEINRNLMGRFQLYRVSKVCGIPQGIFFKPPYQPGDILYVREIAGNCRGKDVLDFDFEELNNDESFQYKNDCQMKCEEGEFSCVLKDEKGDALQVTDYAEEMNKLIVDMEIIDCSPESR